MLERKEGDLRLEESGREGGKEKLGQWGHDALEILVRALVLGRKQSE